MEMQAHPDQCAEVSGCAYTYSSCISAAAGTCNVTDLHDNRTACVGTPGCGHSSVETCAEPVFNACAAGCDLVEASGGDVASCVPTPGNCAYAAVQCDGADMQEGQDVCEEDEACVWSLGFCGAEAVCLGTGWPAELSGSDSVSNSDDDLARQTMCEETSGCYYSNTLATMHLIEAICILLFSVEYVLKLLSCSQRPDKPMGKDGLPRNPAAETMSWATETMNFIDLLAILPWWLSKMTSSEMNIGSPILRMFRMVRVFRILKFGGHVRNLQLFAIGMKRAQEGLMLLLFLLILYLCVFAAVLYQLEYDAQREAGNSGFTSIPTTWYYIMATMTTVGYGDHYPITPWGQLVGGACMICGIFVLGLPIVVVGNTFDEVFKEEEDEVARAKEAAKRLEQQLNEKDGGDETENPLSKDEEQEEEEEEEEEDEPSFNVDVAIHCETDTLAHLPCPPSGLSRLCCGPQTESVPTAPCM